MIIASQYYPGAAVAGINTEAALVVLDFDRASLGNGAGGRFELRGAARVTASVGTDTCTIRVRVGPAGTALGSLTAVYASSAVDAVDNHLAAWAVDLLQLADGSGLAGGFASPIGAPGALATIGTILSSANLGTTSGLRIAVTAQWSTTNANSIRADWFELVRRW